MKLKFLTTFLILALVLPTASAQIIKELPQKTDLDNFTSTIQEGQGFVNTSHSEAIKQLPKAPHDKWIDPSGNYYESFYSVNNSSSIGYDSTYYDDYGNQLPKKCRIVLKLIEPYYGLNATEEICEENTTHEIAGNATEELNNSSDSVLDTSNTLTLFVENKSSGNSIGVTGNFSNEPSDESKESLIEGLKNLIHSVFEWRRN